MYLVKINKRYSYKRRIPELYKHLYPKSREYIKISLKTDSEEIAEKRAQFLNAELEEMWRNAALSGDIDIENRYKEAVRIARLSGFRYKSSQDVSESQVKHILERILSAQKNEDIQENHIPFVLGLGLQKK